MPTILAGIDHIKYAMERGPRASMIWQSITIQSIKLMHACMRGARVRHGCRKRGGGRAVQLSAMWPSACIDHGIDCLSL